MGAHATNCAPRRRRRGFCSSFPLRHMANRSYGVFPSQTAVRSRSVGDLQRLYFKTTTKQEHDWRVIPNEDRPENFDSVHNIGKRTTKYMKYQKKVAPLVDRTACRYNQE